MNFDQLAKDLIRPQTPTQNKNPLERANTLVELANAGFSRTEVFSEMRQLYDSTEDDTLKKQLLDMTVKMHGLYSNEDKKEIPQIVFNIVGSRARLDSMLCPPKLEENAA